MRLFDRFFQRAPAVPPVSQAETAMPQPYSVFTREFDEVISSRYLAEALNNSADRPNLRFDYAVQDFGRRFQHERLEIYEWALPLVRRLTSTHSAAGREKMVVTFLIDHSGSMRGLRMISAMVAIETAVSILSQCGIKTEILGFTTRSWKGGESRKKWRKAGSPPNPGRLCDLRHIIYKEAAKHAIAYGEFHFALHPDLPKKNIDGEALEWAVSRLPADQWNSRAVCFVSDGAPVDDSTLLFNRDQNLLINHLLDTEAQLRGQGVRIGHLLLAGDVNYRDFTLSEIAYEPETAGKGLINIVTRMLFPDEDFALTDG
jgi:cobaltochelatase CobT